MRREKQMHGVATVQQLLLITPRPPVRSALIPDSLAARVCSLPFLATRNFLLAASADAQIVNPCQTARNENHLQQVLLVIGLLLDSRTQSNRYK